MPMSEYMQALALLLEVTWRKCIACRLSSSTFKPLRSYYTTHKIGVQVDQAVLNISLQATRWGRLSSKVCCFDMCCIS